MMRHLPILCLFLAALGLSTPARALLSNPQVQPAQANLAIQRSARITVNWRLTTDAGPSVQSAAGVLEDGGGAVYLTVGRPLSAPAPRAGIDPLTGAARSQAVTLRETLVIPAATVMRAFESGVRQLFYRRNFSDANGTLTSVLVLNITGAGAAGFQLGYLALRFDDDSVRRLVDRDARLQARARLGFSGSGQLRAVWEIAGPSSASGEPVFRTLRLVRRALFGGQEASLDSPPLPTGRAGLYRLRLRVLEPRLDAERVPELQYYVRGEVVAAPQRIVLRAPADGATLAADTRFEWTPLAGASAYRLELRAADAAADAAPRAGMLVNAGRDSLQLSALARRHLEAGARYRWRLIAIDSSGRVIGRSAPRLLRLPAPQP